MYFRTGVKDVLARFGGAPSWEEDRQVRKATRSCPTARARKDATDPLTVHRAWIQGEYAKNGGFLVLGYGPVSPAHKHQETHRETLVTFVTSLQCVWCMDRERTPLEPSAEGSRGVWQRNDTPTQVGHAVLVQQRAWTAPVPSPLRAERAAPRSRPCQPLPRRSHPLRACPHRQLVLVRETPARRRCRHCYLTLTAADLPGRYCPECFETTPTKRYDLDEVMRHGRRTRLLPL